jgi:hypothetical protein
MLARRFTIVCLMLTLFSMFFASIVAQAGRGHRGSERSGSIACAFSLNSTCGSGR